ncbi:sulfotransferase [Rhizobium sp. TH2]|uniref:sulfotransferase family protein n=1 Tax=Rhizobium sp. TH2 TaxID=2775403 RepID=UPI0021587D17|nr:sulfotransferase [Rhizobium sp. TH2]UVC08263.1 sulfotransferase [Rhizobium sp. TH2]
MNLPDFLCIGAQKAGTSWLYKVLQEHPQIFMPPIKELHFFDRIGTDDLKLRHRHQQLARKAVAREERKGDAANRNLIRYLERVVAHDKVSLDWYREAFSWPVAEGVRKGDITPGYLEISEAEVVYARELLGAAKLILIVRRPLDRELSQIRMLAQRDYGTKVPTNDGEWMRLYRRMRKHEDRGAYSQGIPLWQSHFGKENLLILPYGEMRADPRGFLAKIEDFLGIERLETYQYLTAEVHATQKLEIPEGVVARATQKTAAEDAYLKSALGEAFFERTR